MSCSLLVTCPRCGAQRLNLPGHCLCAADARERRADAQAADRAAERKDAERIENGMRRAVKMWETAEYWQRRAAGVIASYERAILAEQDSSHLLDKKKRPAQPPILNYRADGGTITILQRYGPDPETLPQQDMTKAEYKAVYHENRWTVLSEDKSHRLRFASLGGFRGPRVVVFLTDSKAHPAPEVVA